MGNAGRALTALATTIVTVVLGYHTFVQEARVTLEGVEDIKAATADFEGAAAELGTASEKAAEKMQEAAKALEAAAEKSAAVLAKAAAPPEKLELPAAPAAEPASTNGAAPAPASHRAKPARIEPLPPDDHPAPAPAPGSRGFAYGVLQGVFAERDADRTQRSRSADGELRDMFWRTGDDIAVRIVLDLREVDAAHILEHGSFVSPEEAVRAVREQALVAPHILHVILKPPVGTAAAGVPEYSLLHDDRAPALFWLQTVPFKKGVRPDVLTAPDGTKVLGYAYRFRARFTGATVEFLAPGRHTVRPAGWTSSLLEVEDARR